MNSLLYSPYIPELYMLVVKSHLIFVTIYRKFMSARIRVFVHAVYINQKGYFEHNIGKKMSHKLKLMVNCICYSLQRQIWDIRKSYFLTGLHL